MFWSNPTEAPTLNVSNIRSGLGTLAGLHLTVQYKMGAGGC